MLPALDGFVWMWVKNREDDHDEIKGNEDMMQWGVNKMNLEPWWNF